MASKAKKITSPFMKTAQKLLHQEGISFEKWSNDHLREKKMAILEGKDKEWEYETIEKQCEAYVLSKIDNIVSDGNQMKNGGEKYVQETTTSINNTTNK